MLSEENIIISISILAALAAGAAVYQYTDLPSWVGVAVVIGLGIVVPTLVNEHRRRDGDSN